MATILVIGASGQIGKQATGKLLEAGHKVIAPVRSPEKLENRHAPVLPPHLIISSTSPFALASPAFANWASLY